MAANSNLLILFTLALIIGNFKSFAENDDGHKEQGHQDDSHLPFQGAHDELKHFLKHGEPTQYTEQDDSSPADPVESPDSRLFKHIRERLSTLQGEALINELRRMVSDIDKNQNKFLERQEVLDWALAAGEAGAGDVMLDDVVWKGMDLNKDNRVSWEEMVKTIGQNVTNDVTEFEQFKFKLADIDHDGELTKEELVRFLEPHYFKGMIKFMVKDTMKMYDANKDGNVTKQEFLDHVGASYGDHDESDHFDHVDRNKNGFLDEDEVEGLMSEYGIAGIAGNQVTRMFDEADKDGDDKLSVEEVFSHPTIFTHSGLDHRNEHDDGHVDESGLPNDDVAPEYDNEDDDNEAGHDEHDNNSFKDEL